MTRVRHRLLALILVGLVAAPAAWGRPSSPRGPVPAPGALDTVLALLSDWFGFPLQGRWLKEGCALDPFGHCLPAATLDTGCAVEPFGQCLPAAACSPEAANTSGDNGCALDPFGRCMSGH